MRKFKINLSVGIGRNILEAEKALINAKKKKHNNRKYNIEIYSGKKIKSEIIISKELIDAYLRLEKNLSHSPKLLKDLEILKRDPKTKLLNKLGYYIEKQKLEIQNKYHKNKRYIILFDADSMHTLNKKYGYKAVDKQLECIGKALKENIRLTTKDYRTEKDLINIKDVLNNRKNDSAGDEFIIDLYCNKKDLITIAKRYLDKCSEYQENNNHK